ncbi:fumarate reductase subunit C [Thermocatellispora tengchongensis]|uniref:Fumarate reductase subunit C n=1 Tax=Thermocatellispora tengchongensis TaxID=1073253 RepID=A0A840P011_9ACTN|nr:fumarate reductase subunit C [Thermocatellispora tengchongensis]MBB5131241.1 fumarate reductase subunit C [Thermocatellispora tengchongensis]
MTALPSYRPRVHPLWWARRRAYLVFVLRELTSVFVAWSAAYLVLLARAALAGDAEYAEFRAFAGSPWVVALNVVALAATAFHSVTFLNLAPRAMVVRLDGWRVPGFLIAGGNHSAWLAVSALVAYLVLRS